MRFKTYWLLPVLLAAISSGCSNSCAKGDTGPMGPSGSNGTNGQNGYPIATTFLYNNNFDSAANTNEWAFQVSGGGAGSSSLVTSLFLSAPKCMGVFLNGGAGSNVSMGINYAGTGDLIFDSYQNFSGFTAPQQAEYTFFFAGKRHMTIGLDGSGNLYSYNGATQVTIYPAINKNIWHHMTEVWHQSVDTADYYVDNNLVGQSYASNSLVWSTSPTWTYGAAFYMPAAATASGETWYVDNLSIGK